MKAVVLAGGYATRMWPITKHRPKMFLPVGEETVIDVIFEDLEEDDRVSEVFVSTNERFEEVFEEYLDDSPFEKPTLSVEETVEEDEKFGVVGALEQLIDRENVEEDLVVIAGDNLLSFDVGEFVDFFEEKNTPSIAAYDVGSKERAKSYGLVELDGDKVVNFQEKPEEPNSTLVSIACYAFPAETLPKFDEYLTGGNNPDEPGWFIQWLQGKGDVHAFTFDGAWFDIGTPESYLDAVSWYLDGENFVHETANVENSDLGENVHVMANSVVENSTLEKTVIFKDSIIRNADIRNTIVDEDTHIENLDLSNALIGAHSHLE
ncbi:nucleoside-diphosphate-sugar pyrophosphorylase [Halogeometricum pallidum JCM 14848]|uniref:Nucleoside-diphosphate-sugar pyrophosphorylase n=1 Tax=Halogeometricum pallidum JCM 14848 TaxID=1227487 RepID=M0CU24_HALPD|nr:NDP-sugar synthase [Halogeometricum pallidum]ELZ26716.1 nucleoside-diphosphate-sugar pyrophosphorylase [Halogeometricum pallidum JCM 14848]